MTMNTFANKEFLAAIRGDDFAHPGEAEAVDLVLSHLRIDANATVLDAGCGRGGTANMVGKKTGAIVIGIDLDGESVAYANATYQDSQFLVGDMTQLGAMSLPKVDVIYGFNSIYAVADLEGCFAAFRAIANPGARVGVFDYIAYDQASLAKTECLPVTVHTMAEMLTIPAQSGWTCQEIVNLDLDYASWYRAFLARMDDRKDMLSSMRSVQHFDDVRQKYADMLSCLEQGTLGGALHVYTGG